MINNPTAQTELDKPIRHINAMVALYGGATLLNTFTQSDALKSFEVSRVGAGRFFGYGVCARLNVKLIDLDRSINVSAGNTIVITLIAGSSAVHPYAPFTVTEVNRDETTNALSITAYDALNALSEHTTAELNAETPYSIKQYADYIAAGIGAGVLVDPSAARAFALNYPDGANLDGTETQREALDMIAEATQTVYNLRSLDASKNLYNGSLYYQDQTINGITLHDNGNGSFTVTGTATSSFNISAVARQGAQYIKLPRGTYTQQFGTRAQLYTTSGVFVANTYNTFTVTQDNVEVRAIWLQFVAGFTYNKTYYYQIEAGEAATAYEQPHEAGEFIIFKRLAPSDTPIFTINKPRYYKLSSKTNRRLVGLASVTELGDNVKAELEESGTVEYYRDNAFLELREDVGEVLETALSEVGGLTINQFNCNWRGSYLLEVGDCIALQTKDGATVRSYFLNDIATYDGSYNQTTQWEYENTDETETNPTNLGDALKQTYARVDKANRQINIVASQTEGAAADISALQINTNSISASVEQLNASTSGAIQTNAAAIAELNTRVAATMTADQVALKIAQEIAQGTTKVQTETGYTFDGDGLTISKANSDISTKITEDGMSIKRGYDEVLRADNEGVKAEDLHATTYLIIGTNSRFEDYEKDGEPRTGCFWIGTTQ